MGSSDRVGCLETLACSDNGALVLHICVLAKREVLATVLSNRCVDIVVGFLTVGSVGANIADGASTRAGSANTSMSLGYGNEGHQGENTQSNGSEGALELHV
jgi:hypothetical protein